MRTKNRNDPAKRRAGAVKSAEPLDMRKLVPVARKAVRAALLRHKKLGQSVAAWRDGKVVIIPASRIKL